MDKGRSLPCKSSIYAVRALQVMFFSLLVLCFMGWGTRPALAQDGNNTGSGFFTDVRGHWAAAAMNDLAGLKVVSGFPDRTFRPEASVTRAQFIKMLVSSLSLVKYTGSQALSLAPAGDDTVLYRYRDESEVPLWSRMYFAVAIQAGVVSGTPDGFLNPDAPLRRVEMATILGHVLPANVKPAPVAFRDAVPDWAKAPLGRALAAGIIHGYNDGSFHPWDLTTRAQAAQVLDRLIWLPAPAGFGAATTIGEGDEMADHVYLTAPSRLTGNIADQKIHLSGLSNLKYFGLIVEAPGRLSYLYFIPVEHGRFDRDIWLRDGPGFYRLLFSTVRQDEYQSDGSLVVDVDNTSAADIRYTSPSSAVLSRDPAIVTLARQITAGIKDDYAKAKAIHDWVTHNIAYDYAKYLRGTGNPWDNALTTLQSRKGVCQDYAELYAALGRAVGLPVRIAAGEADGESHAWNEVYAGGRWVTLDATWDAGSVIDGRFVADPTDEYFDPDPAVFAQNHTFESDLDE